jgi:putative ABC transport system permease protein
MFRNYLKTLLRFTRKGKLYSFINIAGLAIGIACCILIFLYVQYELSYDAYHKNYDRIYRLTEILHTTKEDNARAVSAPPMAQAIKESTPEVSQTVRISYSERQLSYNEKKIAETSIMYADSSLFDIFTYDMIEGDPKTALVNPYSIVLTETAARKYFGNEPPMGKFMQLSDTINLTVTGIVKDVPKNSHFSFDCVLSRTTINKMNNDQPEDHWFNNNYYTYLLLNKNADAHAVESKIDSTVLGKMKEAVRETGMWYSLKLQPLRDIHLKSNLRAEIDTNGDITYIYISFPQ